MVSNAHEVWVFCRGKCFWGEGLRELSEGNTAHKRFTESQKIFSRKPADILEGLLQMTKEVLPSLSL